MVVVACTASSRFVKCEKCNHFFMVLSELDTKRNLKEQSRDEYRNGFTRKPPPPPKKVLFLLCWQCIRL